jgi:hypothetical protein
MSSLIELCLFGDEKRVSGIERGRFMIRSRTRVVKRHPQGDW